MHLNTDSELSVVFVPPVYLGKVRACFNTCLSPSLGDEEAVGAAAGAQRRFALNSREWH